MKNTKNVNDCLYFGPESNSERPELKLKALPLWATWSVGLPVQLVQRLKQPEDEADRSSVVQNVYLPPTPVRVGGVTLRWKKCPVRPSNSAKWTHSPTFGETAQRRDRHESGVAVLRCVAVGWVLVSTPILG
jgi:hypothetical protein